MKFFVTANWLSVIPYLSFKFNRIRGNFLFTELIKSFALSISIPNAFTNFQWFHSSKYFCLIITTIQIWYFLKRIWLVIMNNFMIFRGINCDDPTNIYSNTVVVTKFEPQKKYEPENFRQNKNFVNLIKVMNLYSAK